MEDTSQQESVYENLDKYMDKTSIESNYVRALVTFEEIDTTNLFKVNMNDVTQLQHLNKLKDKCDLYHIADGVSRKINSFNEVDNDTYQIIYHEGGERTKIQLPVNIPGEIFRTFRFEDVTEEAHTKIPPGNYVDYKYVALEPEDEKMLSTNEALLQKLKTAVNAPLHLQNVGKLLAKTQKRWKGI
jgi:hypothetical protein